MPAKFAFLIDNVYLCDDKMKYNRAVLPRW